MKSMKALHQMLGKRGSLRQPAVKALEKSSTPLGITRRQIFRASVNCSFKMGILTRCLAWQALPIMSLVRCFDAPLLATEANLSLKILRTGDAQLLTAFLPILLGLSPSEANPQELTATMQGIDHLLLRLPQRNRKDFLLLFDILEFPLTRRLLGLRSGWDQASPEHLAELLDAWEHSFFALKQQGYQSVAAMMQLSWYGRESAAKFIGYPGPPESIRPFLHARSEVQE